MAHPSQRKPITMNMTPMIDVVFLLIIFFLVSSHLAQQETQLALDLPPATTGEEPNSHSTERVTINLLDDGTLLLGAQPAQVTELSERLTYSREHAKLPLEVRIRAAQSIPFGQVKPILVACARARVWDVTFAVTEPVGAVP